MLFIWNVFRCGDYVQWEQDRQSNYVRRNTVTRSRNHCCNVKATVYWVYYWATSKCQQQENSVAQQCFEQIYVAGSNTMDAGLLVKCPVLLSDFNPIWIFSTDFHNVPRYQISRKSDQWQPCWHKLTDGRTGMTKLTSTFRDSANARQNYFQLCVAHLVLPEQVPPALTQGR